ncbi:hypothetical protein [Streptomyces luteogriseus]|uniref:hypothetical protein n=1 Tax=Streptomyces luteogriseus TaxID=68233 RepID=UPI0037A07493
MTGREATQAPAIAAGALPPALPSDLAVAARVAQLLLDEHGNVDHRDLFALNRAHGALTESLRVLLRALGVQPDDEKGSSLVRTPGGDQQGWALAPTLGGDQQLSPIGESQRCQTAHAEDPTPCGGPVVVTILDATNAGADGCEHHGARLLASLDGGRVYALPDAPEGAAIRVFKAAGSLRPFAWREVGQ